MCKIFLANSFVWGNHHWIVYLCQHEKYTTLWPMQQVQYSKTCITFKYNLRIDWKFGNKLILSISTEQCYKNDFSESQNGPLKRGWPFMVAWQKIDFHCLVELLFLYFLYSVTQFLTCCWCWQQLVDLPRFWYWAPINQLECIVR